MSAISDHEPGTQAAALDSLLSAMDEDIDKVEAKISRLEEAHEKLVAEKLRVVAMRRAVTERFGG